MLNSMNLAIDNRCSGFSAAALKRFAAWRVGCAGVFILLIALLCATPAWADVRKTDAICGTTMEDRGIRAAKCPSIEAEHAILVDGDGTVYFERDAYSAANIASVTKVMTALVALNRAPLDTEIVVSARAAEVGESSAHLVEGDKMPLETALKALMMPSGNDAALAIAETVGHLLLAEATSSGTQLTDSSGNAITGTDDDAALKVFVAAMNDQAKEVGCLDTVFTNPHGLDDGEWAGKLHSTAADVAKFCAAAMANDTFRNIVSTDTATIQVTRDGEKADIELESTDELLGVYDGACGIKTGFTDLAGSCFAGAASRGGRDLYAIVLDSTSDAKRFEDATALFDWGYENQITYQLAHATDTVSMTANGVASDVPVVAEVSMKAWIDKTVKATFADPSKSVEVFALNGNVSQSFEFAEIGGAVSAGDVVGKATFYQANKVIATVDIVAAESVAAPNIFESFGIWWDRLFKGFSGEAQYAESIVLNDTPLIYDKQSLS